MSVYQNYLVKQEQLIKQLRDGHERAYELMFKTYYKELVVHANKYLSDIESAKEVVQDLFVTIYEKRFNLDISLSLKAYLYKSVQNKCINAIHSAKTREKYARYVKDNSHEPDAIVESELSVSELENALYNAIDGLPPKCRMIFKLNRFEGFSNGEIAEKLELSKRTVETQITKALKILRGKLLPYLAESIALAFIFVALTI
ncbi:MAG: RNA polymerase sigma-70 factor [Bacteroidales bacterium]|nr:RNA polymerase sigma-70 factor [Bacteroidales bacterium]